MLLLGWLLLALVSFQSVCPALSITPGTELFGFDLGGYFPQDIRTDAAGNVYVVKVSGNQGLLVLAGLDSINPPPGTVLEEFRVPGAQTVALDSAGNIYLAQVWTQLPLASLVTVLAGLTSTTQTPGTVIATILNPNPVTDPYTSSYGVALDAADNIYITDSELNIIWVYAALASATPGQLLMNLTGGTIPLDGPVRVAVQQSTGNIYVSNYAGEEIAAYVYDPGFVSVLASITSATPGQTIFKTNDSTRAFDNPNGVAVDAAGRLYVADANNDRIAVLAAIDSTSVLPGTELYSFTGAAASPFGYIGGVYVDAQGRVWVADNYRVVVLAPLEASVPGAVIDVFQPPQESFNVPFCLAIDSHNNVYVDDFENSRIVVLAGITSSNPTQGTIIGVWYDNSTATNDEDTGIGVKGIALDKSDTLYVADTGSNRVLVLAPMTSVSPPPFTVLYVWNGSVPGAEPRDIAFDNSGNVYITEITTGLIIVRAAITSTSPAPGTILHSFTDITNPFAAGSLKGITLDPAENVYVVDANNDRIAVLAALSSNLPAGTELFSFNGSAAVTLQGNPLFVALDSVGRIYIPDNNAGRVLILAGITSVNPPPGTVLDVFIDLPQQISSIEGIAIDAAGNVYASDANFDRVVVMAGLPLVSTAVGDPQFHGWLGQSYQVHGINGAVYSVLSCSSLQVNARFTFLTSGACPVFRHGRTAANCWTHAGSYFGSMGVRSAAGSRLLIVAGNASTGFASIGLDDTNLTAMAFGAEDKDEPVELGAPGLHVTVIDRHHLTVQHGLFTLDIDNSDGFLNLARVTIASWAELTRVVQPHGLLGQSWQRWAGADRGEEVAEVQGRVDDYVDGDDDIFGINNAYSRFVDNQN